MTKRLEEVIAILRELPDTVQDTIADALIANLDAYAEIEGERSRAIDAEQ